MQHACNTLNVLSPERLGLLACYDCSASPLLIDCGGFGRYVGVRLLGGVCGISLLALRLLINLHFTSEAHQLCNC